MNNDAELTIDITTLLRVLKKYAGLIILFSLLGGTVAFALSEYVLPKKYAASAKLYIENSKAQSEIININDITAAKSMVNTCAELFSTRSMAQKLKDATNSPYTVDDIIKMTAMGTSNNTEFLVITITADNAATAANMLAEFIKICLDEFDVTIDSGRIRVVDPAYSTGRPVFPNTKIAVAIGFLIGFLIPYLIGFLIEIFDTKVKAGDDLFKLYNIPVFAEVAFDAKLKGG